jgi:small subunit ribosomal protein S2
MQNFLNHRERGLQLLLDSAVHLGHSERVLHYSIKSYIYGSRNGISIVDLEQTLQGLAKAVSVVRKVRSGGGHVLYVGTGSDVSRMLASFVPSSCSFVNSRWIGGIITNWRSFQSFSVGASASVETPFGFFSRSRHVQRRFMRHFKGLSRRSDLPDLIVVFNFKDHPVVACEASRRGIPVIGVVDTDCDLSGVSYVIPGNDNSLKAQFVYQSLLCF